MANTTASVVSNLSRGTQPVAVYHSSGRPRPIIDYLVACQPVVIGTTAAKTALLGAALTVATGAEGDAAVTPQALSSITSVTLTPGSIQAATALTTEALNAVDSDLVDLKQLSLDELEYPYRTYCSYDSSVGITKALFATLTASVGTSGADLAPAVLITAAETVWANIGCEVDLVAVLSIHQYADLERYVLTTAASKWVPSSDNVFMQTIFEVNGGDDLSRAYRGSLGRIHILVDPNPSGLKTVSGDHVGAVFVPALMGLNGVGLPGEIAARYNQMTREMPGGISIAPAFAMAFREDPARAPREMGAVANPFPPVTLPSGAVVEFMPRAFVGPNLGTVDGFAQVATALLNDNSGCKIISGAT